MQATSETRAAADANAPERLAAKASEVKRSYAHGEDKPLGSHLALVVLYNGLVGAFFAWRRRSGKGFRSRSVPATWCWRASRRTSSAG